MWFLLYWYLPSVILTLITSFVLNKHIAIGDIFIALLAGIFGWTDMLFCVLILVDKYYDKVIFEKK